MDNKPSYDELEAECRELYQTTTRLTNRVHKLEDELAECKEATSPDAPRGKRRKNERFAIMFYPTLEALDKLAKTNQMTSIRLFMHMLRHATPNGAIAQSMRGLAVDIGVDLKSIQRAVKIIVDEDLVAVGKYGHRNVYGINPKYVLKMGLKDSAKAAYHYIARANKAESLDTRMELMSFAIQIDTRAQNSSVGSVNEDS